jgi:hypothetical protein
MEGELKPQGWTNLSIPVCFTQARLFPSHYFVRPEIFIRIYGNQPQNPCKQNGKKPFECAHFCSIISIDDLSVHTVPHLHDGDSAKGYEMKFAKMKFRRGIFLTA